MFRNLFKLLFGATLLVAIFMITNAQPDVSVSVLPVSALPVSVLPVGLKFQKQRLPRPSIPTWRPNIPTWRPNIPTWRPRPPTRRPTFPPTRRPTPPTRRPPLITLRPTPPTKRPTPPTKRPPTWTVTITVTRKPRMVKRALPRKCSKSLKCTAAGPALCVRSRNKKLCRRVANRCALRTLNCQAKPRKNWGVTRQKRCGKLKVGAKAEKCKN
ncbi:non-classical arabinogalactan protein 31-like [Bactrocera tryoni]|uniref:non-classical arabinogalactan protein 31-like n=1 Tax=Bactrocera tryoni TaxID=59916 RepID=UPI001A97F84D|nr:non-classical arabinogalactan protein 31-like [Bactrocera tryoni]